MQISVSSTLTVYHDGQFWVGIVEHVEEGKMGATRIVFGTEPSDEKVFQFVVGRWEKLIFFDGEAPSKSKLAKNPKRRQREVSKTLKQPAMSTKAQQVIANQREAAKRTAVHKRSQKRTEKAEARFEQRKLKRKQKHRGH